MTDETPTTGEQAGFDMDEFRRRQRSRSRIMGISLMALVALIFFVTLAKMGLATK